MDKTSDKEAEQVEKKPLVELQLLVVDDDESIATAVSSMLRKAGATVTMVHTPDHALEACRTDSFDLVFTDLVMEGADGLELMESIRVIDNSIGVVLMTSHAAPEVASNAAERGVNGFLRKPFKYDACLEQAIKALRYRREKLGLETRVVQTATDA